MKQVLGTFSVQNATTLLRDMGFEPYRDNDTGRLNPHRWINGGEALTIKVLNSNFPGRVQIQSEAKRKAS